MIRPAKCHFNGFIKPSIKGADKNHNPRKGTEILVTWQLNQFEYYDKNHNPRKGTEINPYTLIYPQIHSHDKNHNPRKGTEIPACQSSLQICIYR